MMSVFIERLKPEAHQGTVLVLMADHGQIAIRKDPHFEPRNHSDLLRRLHLLPAGENRFAYLYLKPGQIEAIEEYFSQTWPNSFITLPSAHALHAGLFGPGTPASSAPDRLGDRLAIGQGNASLWWANKENPLIGRHGGLTPEEMLLPFLAVRLNA